MPFWSRWTNRPSKPEYYNRTCVLIAADNLYRQAFAAALAQRGRVQTLAFPSHRIPVTLPPVPVILIEPEEHEVKRFLGHPAPVIAVTRRPAPGQVRAVTPDADLDTLCAEIFDVPLVQDVPSLTSREREILHLLVLGYDRKSIAIELRISLKTVDYHITNVYQKLGVRTQAQAVAEALRLNIATFPSQGRSRKYPRTQTK
jgi:DNA-binding CsgD family transcriptional regulator